MTEASQPTAQPAEPRQEPQLLTRIRRYLGYLPFPLPLIAAGFIVLTIVTAAVIYVAD